MNIGKYLEQIGVDVLRGTPAGGIVADLVEIAIQDVIDGSATGASTVERVNALPDDAKSRLLNKELPDGLVKLPAWSQPAPPPAARGGFVGALLVFVLVLADCFVSAMIGWKYFMQGTLPTEEMVSILLGIPVVGICIYYGVGTDRLMQAMVDLAEQRKSKS